MLPSPSEAWEQLESVNLSPVTQKIKLCIGRQESVDGHPGRGLQGWQILSSSRILSYFGT